MKTLYLESNAIADIEGLDALINLRCLYLGKNMIHEIAGLDTLTQLESLDLSENDIRCVEGLASLPKLKFLSLAGDFATANAAHAIDCMFCMTYQHKKTYCSSHLPTRGRRLIGRTLETAKCVQLSCLALDHSVQLTTLRTNTAETLVILLEACKECLGSSRECYQPAAMLPDSRQHQNLPIKSTAAQQKSIRPCISMLAASWSLPARTIEQL